MKILFCFLSVSGLLGLVLVSPVGAEIVGANDRSPLQIDESSDLIAQGITRVTGVEVIQTEDGLELVLETVAGSERMECYCRLCLYRCQNYRR